MPANTVLRFIKARFDEGDVDEPISEFQGRCGSGGTLEAIEQRLDALAGEVEHLPGGLFDMSKKVLR